MALSYGAARRAHGRGHRVGLPAFSELQWLPPSNGHVDMRAEDYSHRHLAGPEATILMWRYWHAIGGMPVIARARPKGPRAVNILFSLRLGLSSDGCPARKRGCCEGSAPHIVIPSRR